MLRLIDLTEPLEAQCDPEIQKIISEEAAAFYAGQKTADEAARIIRGAGADVHQ